MTLPESSDYEQDEPIYEEAHQRKYKFSMISNEFKMREKRKRILQLCLRKLEKIKDSELNLRKSVCIHQTFSRLSAELRKDKEKSKKYLQHSKKLPRIPPNNQNIPKRTEKLDLENLDKELCSIEDDRPSWDPILRNCEEIEQALSRKRKAEVEEVLLSYHQLEKRLKTDIKASSFFDAFREASPEGQLDFQCINVDTPSNGNSGSGFANSFQPSCSKFAALDSSNGNFQSLAGRLET